MHDEYHLATTQIHKAQTINFTVETAKQHSFSTGFRMNLVTQSENQGQPQGQTSRIWAPT